MEEEARLVILKELRKEDNKAMSSNRMQKFLLARFLIDKSRQWVELQYTYLKEMGAVTILKNDTTDIARLTERGEQHLLGLITLPGVMPASNRPED